MFSFKLSPTYSPDFLNFCTVNQSIYLTPSFCSLFLHYLCTFSEITGCRIQALSAFKSLRVVCNSFFNFCIYFQFFFASFIRGLTATVYIFFNLSFASFNSFFLYSNIYWQVILSFSNEFYVAVNSDFYLRYSQRITFASLPFSIALMYH